MGLTERFLHLAALQLRSLRASGALERLVLYTAQGQSDDNASLEMVMQWPETTLPLPPAEADPDLRTPSTERRWYPLRDGNLLLGALRAERLRDLEWSDDLEQRLQAGRESAFLSKQLATIVCDLPLSVAAEDLELCVPDWGALDALCARLGFTTLPDRARRQLERAPEQPD